jgi:Family of unknown function (DUF6090)
MIKFFRKIRYDLMEKNKTGKYFKYAIGEIILVVIGILIALSINNWNEERKDNLQRITLLENLKSEYLINLEEINNRIQTVDTTLKYATIVIRLMRPDYETLDEVQVTNNIANVINWFTTYDESSGALQDIIYNNKLGLIKVDSLRISLASWNQNVDNVKEREARCLNLFQNQLMPYVHKNFVTLKIDYPKGSKLHSDNRHIMDDLQFETLLDDYRWNLTILKRQYNVMREELNKILKLIEKEQKS